MASAPAMTTTRSWRLTSAPSLDYTYRFLHPMSDALYSLFFLRGGKLPASRDAAYGCIQTRTRWCYCECRALTCIACLFTRTCMSVCEYYLNIFIGDFSALILCFSACTSAWMQFCNLIILNQCLH